MNKRCILVGTAVFGLGGRLLAGALGMATFSPGSLLLSGGGIFGVWAGWKVAQKFN